MSLVHESLSNIKLCELASNPYILLPTYRKDKVVSNVLETIRATSLYNSTNMPSYTWIDESWLKTIPSNI